MTGNRQEASVTNSSPWGGSEVGAHHPFLYYVAKNLIGRYGNNMSGVTIVFPGKRAELYMNSFLSHIAQGPVWAPRFMTIDELFQKFSKLTPCDNILAICRLYRIYAELMPNPEPLDDFYGWGEILLNDFGDIDKHMADADRLFTNAADLAALDHVDYLTDQQIEALQQFFAHFDPKHQTLVKQRFMELWQIMPKLYHRLKEELRRDGVMYKGGIYREVAEKIKDGGLRMKDDKEKNSSSSLYAFVGFNVLDEVEETLFAHLRDAGQALFYWDYDTHYASPTSDHEAGLFMRHNLTTFPNALSNEDIYDNLLDKEKRIRILAADTDNAQVRYLANCQADAIILCDETLMRPSLHALPDDKGHNAYNLTMGYPLTDTAVYGYFSALIDLQTEGYDTQLQAFLPTALERVQKNPFFTTFPQDMHPILPQEGNLDLIDWLIQAIEALGLSLSQTETTSAYNQLYTEATFQLYKILGQFRWLTTEGNLDIMPRTLRRLIRQAISATSIPFHGEMDEGIQVMGLLEARNLDFRRLVMLSVGEGIIPRRASDTSLIPYILRAHFGLDTTERQDAVYAYSFYRLLQRAEEVTLIYNNNTSGASQREASRFLRQVLAETGLTIEQGSLAPTQQPLAPNAPIVVQKDARIMASLHSRHSLSPSAINQYADCPLSFYYQQVAQLRIPDRPQDGIDARHFGTIFHDACEHFYKQLCQTTGRKQVLRSDLEHFLAPLTPHNSPLAPHVNRAFEKNNFTYHSGTNMIIHNVIIQLMQKLIRWDMEHTPFSIYEMETDHYTYITIPSGDKEVTLKVGGRIDRMDIMRIDGEETLRVVDYKTGHPKPAPTGIEDIFTGTSVKACGYYLQTFLYSLIMEREQSLPVCPCLFYVLAATDSQHYDPILRMGKERITNIRDYADEYTEGLRGLIEEIYDPSRPFVQVEEDQRHCEYCDFRQLCGR